MIHDLYLRAHVVPEKTKDQKTGSSKPQPPDKWAKHALVFDTETELDLKQTLNFGIWRFCKLEGKKYVATQEGIFYRDGLSTEDIARIRAYAAKHFSDGLVGAARPPLTVLSRADFVEHVFWESVRAGALIVGFNLSFDISRIAVSWKAARSGGFSFVLSELSEKHVENVHRPRIRVSPLNGVAERIKLSAVHKKDDQSRWRNGRFLDLHTLAFALSDSSFKLENAIKEFNASEEKMEYEPTGLVTEEEIAYARQDVRATVGLLNALKNEYDLHPIELLPDEAYSPASIGKAYLRAMGVEEPMQKFKDIPARIHGIAMSAYFGGRAECRIRRWPVPVMPVDLTSEYPTVDALLGTWDFLTARALSIQDATTEVRALLTLCDLNDLFRREWWKHLNFYARIAPDGDILPVRSMYGAKSGTVNIGLNALHSPEPLWVAGPDLVASVLLSGRIPAVLEAFRIVPEGQQAGLEPVELRSAISIDPRKVDFFTRVIEYRKQNASDKKLQHFLKILANSTSYGTYLELNPVKQSRRKAGRINVYCGDQEFSQPTPDVIERPGRFYFPLLGALITAGGRLLLAMIEKAVRDEGGTYLSCDTDALTIVASKTGGPVTMPDGAEPVNALSWVQVDRIRDRFDSLTPYDRNIVPNLLRLTDENFDENGTVRQLFGLSIAAKRYVLYTSRCGKPLCGHRKCVEIAEPKAHGLIFFAPNDERENKLPKWWWELWRFILMLEFRQIRDPEFKPVLIAGRVLDSATTVDIEGIPSWTTLPAMMKMRMSTPHYLKQMKNQASPFGFVLHPRTRDQLKLTLLTPFTKNRRVWEHSVCTHTRDGSIHILDQLPRNTVITLGDVLIGYVQHTEVKSLGPDGGRCKADTRGLLRRMDINAGLQRPIGKEVSRFEQGYDDFVDNIDDDCIHYDGGRVAANESLRLEIKALGLRKTSELTGLDRKTIRAIANGEQIKPATLAKVLMRMPGH